MTESQGSACARLGGRVVTVGQIVLRAAGGSDARRSARPASTVLPVSLRPEPACAVPATRAAAARTRVRQAGLGPAARPGAPVPMTGTVTRRRDVAAVPLGGPASAAREPVTVGTGDLTAAMPAPAAQATGAVTPSVACACVSLATWARSARSVSPGPAHTRVHTRTHAHAHKHLSRTQSWSPVHRQAAWTRPLSPTCHTEGPPGAVGRAGWGQLHHTGHLAPAGEVEGSAKD